MQNPAPVSASTREVVDSIKITAPAAKVLAALTTAAGIRAWWTTDCEVNAAQHTYRFRTEGPGAEATFRVNRQDDGGIVLVGIAETTGMGWLGTRLGFALEPSGNTTRVALSHAGFAPTGSNYDDCVSGWRHFLGSLKAYLETGTGTPHVPGQRVTRQ